MPQTGKEPVVQDLQRCQKRFGKCTPRLLNSMEDTVSPSLVMSRFDDWTSAKEAAGIEEECSSKASADKQYSDEEVLDHIRECAHRNDGVCTVQHMNAEDDLVPPSVAIDRFNSWQAAKRKAGLEKDQ